MIKFLFNLNVKTFLKDMCIDALSLQNIPNVGRHKND